MFEIGLGHYLTLGAIIFTIGVAGIFLNRKNIIVILMSIELILLAVNINLVSFSAYLPPNVDIRVSKASIVLDIVLIKTGSFGFVKQLILLVCSLIASRYLTN